MELTPIETAQTTVESNQPEKFIKGFWVSKTDQLKVSIYCYTKETGEMAWVSPIQIEEDKKTLLNLKENEITAGFSLPSRKQLERYRERASKWVDEAQALVINRSLVRNLILRNHLQSIEGIIDPETQKTLEIKKQSGSEVLSKETEAKIEDLHPSIFESLLNKFITHADLMF